MVSLSFTRRPEEGTSASPHSRLTDDTPLLWDEHPINFHSIYSVKEFLLKKKPLGRLRAEVATKHLKNRPMNGSVERANWSHSFSRQSSIVRTPTHTRSQTHKNKTEKDITANKKEHKLSSSFLGYSFSKRAHKTKRG